MATAMAPPPQAPPPQASPPPPTLAPALAFRGTIVHAPRLGCVDVLADHLVVVRAGGAISHLGPAADAPAADAALAAAGLGPERVRQLLPSQFLLPGFIDAHCHTPQFEFAGVGTDLPLFAWLEEYTFPTEARHADVAHAREVYRACIAALLALGTTTANHFATLHVPACKTLADVCAAAGARAVVGKVCMDQNSPGSYVERSAADSAAGAREVAEYVRGLGCSRLTASVVPRFIPTCSADLLSALGRLAEELGLAVHSHISESRDQVAFTGSLHAGRHDAAVYDGAGLLRCGAVFAHGTQLGDEELRLLARRGAALAHCPLSNFFFGDTLLDVRRALGLGVTVGLGTDVAGGYSPSMLVAMRLAVVNSHALKAAALQSGAAGSEVPRRPEQAQQQKQQEQQEQQPGPLSPGACQPCETAGSRVAAAISNEQVAAAAAAHMLTWEDALHLATAGGAAALGLSGRVGHFAEGMEFDALLVDAAAGPLGALQRRGRQHEPLALLEHFLNNGDDRNILEVYVQGALVAGAAWPGAGVG